MRGFARQGCRACSFVLRALVRSKLRYCGTVRVSQAGRGGGRVKKSETCVRHARQRDMWRRTSCRIDVKFQLCSRRRHPTSVPVWWTPELRPNIAISGQRREACACAPRTATSPVGRRTGATAGSVNAQRNARADQHARVLGPVQHDFQPLLQRRKGKGRRSPGLAPTTTARGAQLSMLVESGCARAAAAGPLAGPRGGRGALTKVSAAVSCACTFFLQNYLDSTFCILSANEKHRKSEAGSYFDELFADRLPRLFRLPHFQPQVNLQRTRQSAQRDISPHTVATPNISTVLCVQSS